MRLELTLRRAMRRAPTQSVLASPSAPSDAASGEPIRSEASPSRDGASRTHDRRQRLRAMLATTLPESAESTRLQALLEVAERKAAAEATAQGQPLTSAVDDTRRPANIVVPADADATTPGASPADETRAAEAKAAVREALEAADAAQKLAEAANAATAKLCEAQAKQKRSPRDKDGDKQLGQELDQEPRAELRAEPEGAAEAAAARRVGSRTISFSFRSKGGGKAAPKSATSEGTAPGEAAAGPTSSGQGLERESTPPSSPANCPAATMERVKATMKEVKKIRRTYGIVDESSPFMPSPTAHDAYSPQGSASSALRTPGGSSPLPGRSLSYPTKGMRTPAADHAMAV